MAGKRVRVAGVADLQPGEGRVVEAEGRVVALFNVDGSYHAVDNACAHRGGPLGAGDLDGRTVSCPWHGWRWDVTTGASTTNPALRVACFPVSIDNDGVYVDVG